MRWGRLAAFGALASCGLVQCASADEYKPRRAATATAAAPAPTTNWNGFQTGANGGTSSLAQNFAEPGAFLCPGGGGPGVVAAPCPETPFAFSGHPSSLTAGGFLGYRLQFGGLVVGIEGDASWKRATTAYTQTGTTPLGVTESFSGSIQQGWDGSIRGRLGALLSPTLLAYATGGVAFGEVGGSFSYSAGTNPPGVAACVAGPCVPIVSGAGSWRDTQVGYTVGGGLEAALGGGLKARIEYRYTDFGHISQDVPLTGCAAGFTCGTNAHIDTNAAFHTVRLGLGIDF